MPSTPNIVVIGLGYVGLPLAVALSKHYPVRGFDLDLVRVRQLRNGFDRNNEIQSSDLRASTLELSSGTRDIKDGDVYIITVPTPVYEDNKPDLRALRGASEIVGRAMKKGAIVVSESTVYPGITEDFCGKVLEEASGMICGEDFFLGYSPERINPGDKKHTVTRVKKVVSGQTPDVAQKLADIYGTVTTGGTFIARDIKTAEAAKVIENAQRDINIAFINEVAMVFDRMGISVYDVLAAAGTKWNFLPFTPGLVGGHCIGVDPFYLAHCAEEVGHNPEVILAGRRTNDGMGKYLAKRIAEEIKKLPRKKKVPHVLILGLTFKENVPDLRNTKVTDVMHGLVEQGCRVHIHDPCADADEAKSFFGINLKTSLDGLKNYDCIVGAVAHSAYKDFTVQSFETLVKPGGLVADIKGMWRHLELPKGLTRWQL